MIVPKAVKAVGNAVIVVVMNAVVRIVSRVIGLAVTVVVATASISRASNRPTQTNRA